jgi:hypothetical protein
MSNLAFRDFTDLNLDDPDAAIASVVEELARAGIRHAGKILPRDRQRAVRFIERLRDLTEDEWHAVVDRAWAEVGKRRDVLAAMLAGIQWEQAGADLIESTELPAAVRTKLSRDEQVLLGTELLERHMAADVVVEGTILALLWHEYAPGWYETFADVIPLSSLVTDGLWSTGVDEPPNG